MKLKVAVPGLNVKGDSSLHIQVSLVSHFWLKICSAFYLELNALPLIQEAVPRWRDERCLVKTHLEYTCTSLVDREIAEEGINEIWNQWFRRFFILG